MTRMGGVTGEDIMETTTAAVTAEVQSEDRWTYRLSDHELAATREKIAKLNARAARRGLAGELSVSAEQVTETRTLRSGFTVTEVYWEASILGTAPQYKGWKFIASLDFDPAAGLVTRTVPGFEGTVDRSKLRENWCEHCKTDRLRRNVYLLENAGTGQRVQVGSSCVKDFLGQSVRPVITTKATVCEELGGFGASDYDVTPLDALAIAWAAVQEFGFVRSGDDYDVPTKHRIEQVLYPSNKGQSALDDRALGDRLRPLAARAAAQALLIRDYILSDEFKGDEYVANLKAITGAERVGRRFFGQLASAPQAWARSVEQDLRRQAEQATVTNEFFGTVKERLELTVRVKSIRFWDGDYGITTVYTLITDTGHLAQWYSSSGTLGNEVTNRTYKVKATVKGHEEYKDTKYTKLTRVTVIEDHPGEESA